MTVRLSFVITLVTPFALLTIAFVGQVASQTLRSSASSRALQEEGCLVATAKGPLSCEESIGVGGKPCVWCFIDGSDGLCVSEAQAEGMLGALGVDCGSDHKVASCDINTAETDCTDAGCTWCTWKSPLMSDSGVCYNDIQVDVADPDFLDCGAFTGSASYFSRELNETAFGNETTFGNATDAVEGFNVVDILEYKDVSCLSVTANGKVFCKGQKDELGQVCLWCFSKEAGNFCISPNQTSVAEALELTCV